MFRSGSTFVFQKASELIRLHGITSDADGHRANRTKEFLRHYMADHKKRLGKGERMFQGMRECFDAEMRDAKATQDIFLSNIISPTRELRYPGIPGMLQKWNASSVVILRANVLDRAICTIRDCIQAGEYPGFEIGSRVPRQSKGKGNTCFNRRSAGQNVTVMANVHVPNLIRALQYSLRAEDRWRDHLKQAGLPHDVPVFTYEALAAFQYEEKGATTRSLEAWLQLLSAWGLNPDRKIVSEHLLAHANQRLSPGPHNASVLNFDELKEALQIRASNGMPGLASLLREPS
jgi:hypothetical protein